MQSEKRILILDRQLVAKIDEHRGELSQAEFIDLCIDTCLETEASAARRPVIERPPPPPAPPPASAPATREDFEEFTKTTKELVRALLEFFVTFGLDVAPGKAVGNPDVLRDQLRSLLDGL